MKNYLLFPLLVAFVLYVAGFGATNANSGQYPSVNSTLCAKYLGMAQKAEKNNNLSLAKLFARKAIQADVFNMKAWKEYDSIVSKMSGGNNTQTNIPSATPSSPSASKPQAPTGGGAFEGC